MAARKKLPAASAATQTTVSTDTADGRATLAIMPSVNSAIVIDAFCKSLGTQSVSDLVQPLRENIKDVQGGNLAKADAMLISQAYALQTIFTELSRRAALNMGEHMGAVETYLRLALKAQAQCTRTLEVLAAMKNPPVVFAKQANIAHGHQQVNNAPPQSGQNSTRSGAHAQENEIKQNELLEANHGSKTLDSRATQTAISQDKKVGAVG